MKRFMVLYNSPVPASEQMAKSTPEERKAGMDAWMTWAGKDGEAMDGNSSQASGYSLLQGASKDDVDALLADHPNLKMPGASIEVFEALAMPGS